jgi:SAM-dependent methyltransferase
MATPARGETILDAGCGSGKGALALQAAGFTLRLCDLTADGLVPEAQSIPFDTVCLWHDLSLQLRYVEGGAFDWVYCCDVLEHIDEALTMLVIARLLAVTRRGLFLSIATVPDAHGVWIGETLHHTVKPFIWWRDHLREVCELVEARDLLTAAVFLVRPC